MNPGASLGHRLRGNVLIFPAPCLGTGFAVREGKIHINNARRGTKVQYRTITGAPGRPI